MHKGNFHSFVEYMEQDMFCSSDGSVVQVEFPTIIVGEDEIYTEEILAEMTYYDEYGNKFSNGEKVEDLTEALYDSQGNIICTYIRRNESVAIIKQNINGNNFESITVITYEGLRAGEYKQNKINYLFIGAYVIEVLVGLVVYCGKREK